MSKQDQGIPNARESIKFCSGLWNDSIDFNVNIDWMMTVEKELYNITQQNDIIITIVTRNNIVWKLARGYNFCYRKV